MKIRDVGAKLFHIGARADRQVYITKLTTAFRKCENSPKTKGNYLKLHAIMRHILIPHASAWSWNDEKRRRQELSSQ
jgi:hypothetical protein